MLRNSFHSLKIELRDSTPKKILFATVRITRIVLWLLKLSNNQFWLILHTKWLLKIQLNFQLIEDMQDSFGALLKTLGRTAIAFYKIYIIPAANRKEADLFKIAAPEIEGPVCGRKKLEFSLKEARAKEIWKQMGGQKRNPCVELVEPDPLLEKYVKKQSLLQKDFWQKTRSIFQRSRSFYINWIGDFC